MITLDTCLRLDEADPLREARALLAPGEPGTVYLDANSLGPMPAAAPERVLHAMNAQWCAQRANAWPLARWSQKPAAIGALYAPLLGARPNELIAVDNTTLNLHKLLACALALAGRDPARCAIVYEGDGFPTDCHVVQAAVRHGGGRWRERPIATSEEALAQALGSDVAVVVLSHADYRTSFRWDMKRITARIHEAGALVIWDLSHTAGAVAIDLDDSRADFAVASGYKYLCGGPGAPALAFMRADLQGQEWPLLAGWQGHAKPLSFDPAYQPAAGMQSLMSGTTTALQNAAAECAAEIFAGIDRNALSRKHESLSNMAVALLRQECGEFGVTLISPADYAHRGGHIAFRCEGGDDVSKALVAQGVVNTFRSPDVIRFGLSPLAVTHGDLWEAVARLRGILSTHRSRSAP